MPLNTILYGPPGTGKTYQTINQALAILDPDFAQVHEEDRLLLKQRFDALREQGRIFFVTFHQSFSYEDFVEGIKASTNEGSVYYAVEPGVFKDACDAALTKPGGQSVDEVIAQFVEEITDNPITLKTRTGKEFEASYREGLSRITCRPKEASSDAMHGASIDLIKQVLRGHHPKEVYNRSYVKGIAEFLKGRLGHDQFDFYVGQQFKDYRISGVSNEIVEITKPNDKVLPFPRTVIDTLAAKVKAGVLTIDAIKNKEWQAAAPSIEPFLVNGYSNLVPPMVDYLVHGMGSKPQAEHCAQPVVLIIDEINRGNISSIFGELITLIEPSKRAGAEEALSVTLPYSKEVFQVPSNLYLIGTMNTADRSLALMDTALRRRFEFVEMMPQPARLKRPTIKGINVAAMLSKMNQRIELLYDREHTLGHAFFMHLLDMEEDSAFDALRTVFENKVLPLLEEYFFEDWEKIRLVLADNQKRDSDKQFIVIDESADSSALFGRDAELGYDDEGLKTYRRNATALALPEAYIAIYES